MHIYHSLHHSYSVMLIIDFKYFLLLCIQIQLLLALWSVWSIWLSVNCCESHWSWYEYVISCISNDWNLPSINRDSTCCIWSCNVCSVHKVIVVLSIMLILVLELLLGIFVTVIVCHISFVWYSDCSFLIMTV